MKMVRSDEPKGSPSPAKSLPVSGSADALLERLQAATGPERELDERIWCAVEGFSYVCREPSGWFVAEWNGRRQTVCPPLPYTASVDAAMALVERVLPGWDGIVGFGHRGKQAADLWGPVTEVGEDEYGEPVEIRNTAAGDGSSPALALLAAMLSALSAEPRNGSPTLAKAEGPSDSND